VKKRRKAERLDPHDEWIGWTPLLQGLFSIELSISTTRNDLQETHWSVSSFMLRHPCLAQTNGERTIGFPNQFAAENDATLSSNAE
jgi:hypothetical protein